MCVGLFVADQTLRRDGDYSSAIYTRQNPNGNRRGYECPEERDYYPYWHPTPWRDIAILADNETQCDMFRRESNNRVVRGICQETYSNGDAKYWSTYNNEADCKNNNRKLVVSFYPCCFTLRYVIDSWVQLYAYLDIDDSITTESACVGPDRAWAQPWLHEEPVCLVLPPEPECMAAGWTRVNHLGNGRDAVPLNYTWKLPHFPSGRPHRCVLRLR